MRQMEISEVLRERDYRLRSGRQKKLALSTPHALSLFDESSRRFGICAT